MPHTFFSSDAVGRWICGYKDANDIHYFFDFFLCFVMLMACACCVLDTKEVGEFLKA